MEAWAVVEHEKPLQKITGEVPKPSGTEVLVKVTHCGICHSDVHYWEGGFDLGDGKTLRIKDRGIELPVAIGHEILGTVLELGPDAAEQGVKEGDSRVVYPWLGCGSCSRCAREEDNMCQKQRSLGIMQHGGFASHVLVPHPKYLVDYGDVDPAVACTFGCSGLTVLSALKKIMPIDPEELIVLNGAGGLGLQAIQMLKALGHHKIVSVDISDEKLAAAKKAGATHTVNSAAADAAQEIQRLAGGPVLGILDFVANSQTAAMAHALMGKGGRMVLLGVMGGTFQVSCVGLIFRGATIYGNITGNPQHLRDVAELAKAGKLGAVPVSTTGWDNANDALMQLRDGKVTGRLILVHP